MPLPYMGAVENGTINYNLKFSGRKKAAIRRPFLRYI